MKILRQWLNAQASACASLERDLTLGHPWYGDSDQRKRTDELIAVIEKADRIIPLLIGFASESAQ
jgi:hypothetical protein